MITKIVIDAFKGAQCTVRLPESGRALFVGPNGVGKTAVLDGVKYALTGRVAGGKSLDEVAKCFPPDGGFVRLEDGEGFIERGIVRDHGKAKVSEEFQAEPSAEHWRPSEAVLDLREFLSLSAAKRREFVLRLCGSATNSDPRPGLIEAIGTEYARSVLGSLGMAASLDTVPLRDLSDDEAQLVNAWREDRGILEQLDAALSALGGKTASEVCLRLAGMARESKNTAHRGAKEARAAIKELEETAQGARAAAELLTRRRRECELASESLSRAREAAAEEAERRRGVQELERDVAHARKGLEGAKSAVDSLPPVGDEPQRPEPSGELAECEQQLKRARLHVESTRSELETIRERETRLADTRARLEDAEEDLDLHRRLTVGRMAARIEQIPDHAHPEIPALRADIESLALEWSTRRDNLERECEELRRAVSDLHDAVREHLAQKEALESEEREQVETCQSLAKSAQELTQDAAEKQYEYEEEFRSWYGRQTERNKLLIRRDAENRRLTEAQTRLDELRQRCSDAPDVDVAAAEYHRARDALEAAEKAAGAVSAYDEAVARAGRETVLWEAWKRVEAAIGAARETQVEETTRPLLTEIQRVLTLAGRPEQAYVTLENERGRPVFDIGWVRDDHRISISALSGGEAVLFCAAVSLAIAGRSEGRKILLVEADQLDADNLPSCLDALARIDGLDACLFATSRDVVGDPEGWSTIRLTPSEEVRERRKEVMPT